MTETNYHFQVRRLDSPEPCWITLRGQATPEAAEQSRWHVVDGEARPLWDGYEQRIVRITTEVIATVA